EADLDALRSLGVDRDVDSLPVPGHAQRGGLPRPDVAGDAHSTASSTPTGKSVRSGPTARPPSTGATPVPVTRFRKRRPASVGGSLTRVVPQTGPRPAFRPRSTPRRATTRTPA